MKLLLGLGFKLGFVPIFHCPAPRAVPRFPFWSTGAIKATTETKLRVQLVRANAFYLRLS